jgi:hypothetical protein
MWDDRHRERAERDREKDQSELDNPPGHNRTERTQERQIEEHAAPHRRIFGNILHDMLGNPLCDVLENTLRDPLGHIRQRRWPAESCYRLSPYFRREDEHQLRRKWLVRYELIDVHHQAVGS